MGAERTGGSAADETPTVAELPEPRARPGPSAARAPAEDELRGLPPRIGRYVVLRELGRGGMGVVYAAYDEELDRRIALKVLHASRAADADARARILRESRALARLSHPNVVHVYEVGDFEGSVYLAMEHVHGVTLRQWLKEPRPWRASLAMLIETGRGLSAAHHASLVHREHKPPPRNPAPDTGAPPISSDPAELRGRGLPRIPPHCPARAPFGGKTMATATAREFSGVTASRWASERHTARFAILSANGPRVPWPAVYHLRRSAPSRAMTAAAAG